MKKFLAIALLFLSAGCQGSSRMPSGAINHDVTQATINKTICVSGWTATVRPSSYKTNKIKADKLISEKLPGTIADYELDHVISIELGGALLDPKNLWMEPLSGPSGAIVKDRLENALKRDVCSGKIKLSTARRLIAKDWINEYNRRYPTTPIK